MATRVGEQTKIPIEPVVTVKEMDHIAMRVKDVDASLRFYHKILGLPTERLDEFRDGKVPFPSVRINGDTIIDFFNFDGMTGSSIEPRNLDHYCIVVEPTDLAEVAKGAGIPHVAAVTTLEGLEEALDRAVAEDGPWCIVAEIEEMVDENRGDH